MDIVITEAEGLRLLQFGTHWCQGAMRIAAPDRLELEYAVRMCAWMLFHDPQQLAGRHLATLGLGALGTLNVVPDALRDTYGTRTPPGVMLFLRLRPSRTPHAATDDMAGMPM